MAAAGAALAAGVKHAYDLGGELNDLSSRTGIAAGKALIMRQAFEDSGLAADDVGASVNKMQRYIEAAANGNDTASATFQKLGLSLARIQQLTPDEQFAAIGRSLNSVQGETSRAALSMDLFGKSGGKFLALFADGGALETAAASLGKQAKILDENAGTFDDISDRLGRSGKKLQGFFVGVAERLSTTLKPVLEQFGSGSV
jgi:hypothetical protein